MKRSQLFSQNKNISQDNGIIYKCYRSEPPIHIFHKQFFLSRMSSFLAPMKCLIMDKGKVWGYGMEYIEGQSPSFNYLISNLPKIEEELFHKRIVLIDAAVVNFIGLRFIDYDFLSVQTLEDVIKDTRLINQYGNRRVRMFAFYIAATMNSPLNLAEIKLWPQAMS